MHSPTQSSSPQGSNRLRYYYEDGRGCKVWVQNLTLDYDAERVGGATPKRKSRYVDPWSVPRQRPRGAAYRISSARQQSARPIVVGDDAHLMSLHRKSPTPVTRSATQSPPRRDTRQMSTFCTCACLKHNAHGQDEFKWTFMPQEKIDSFINSVEDAEQILEELRREESFLLKIRTP